MSNSNELSLEAAGFSIIEGEEDEYQEFEVEGLNPPPTSKHIVNKTTFDIEAGLDPDTNGERAKELARKDYRFDFIGLENEVNRCYRRVKLHECDEDGCEYSDAIGHFYRSVAELVYGIFCVDPPFVHKKRGMDPYNQACNHALYIVERVKNKTLDWDPTERQAWTRYLRLNTRYHYAVMPTLPDNTTRSLDQIFEQVELKLSTLKKIEEEEFPLPNPVTYQDKAKLIKQGFVDQLFVLIKSFYPKDDIFRLMPIAVSSIKYGFEINKEVIRFKCLLINLLKRLTDYYKDTDQIESSVLSESIDKSVITLLLLNFVSFTDQNSLIPFDLVSSLDFHSLMRLAATGGGKTIRIPTVKDLETVVASSVALSAMLLDGANFREARTRAKEIVGLRSNVRSLNRFMKDMKDCLSPATSNVLTMVNRSSGDSFLADLIKSFKLSNKSMIKILDRMESEILSLTPEQLIEYLKTLDESERKLLNFLERMSSLQEFKMY